MSNNDGDNTWCFFVLTPSKAGIGSVNQNAQAGGIPVLDLFAGPGGLAEGFSALHTIGRNAFKVCLSVEKDRFAHSTLELRSFFRQFPRGQVPDEYYAYLRQEITRDDLFDRYSCEAEAAKTEAWCAELGSPKFPTEEVDARIEKALGGSKNWVLIGGPPCQAYSTAGRSRNKGKKGYIPEEDKRHFLYREYLRIIAKHWPSVFVMENVKGMLSARVNGSKIFDHILEDLHDPLSTLKDNKSGEPCGYKYKIYSLVKPTSYPFDNTQPEFSSSDYLIMGEDYGLPQARHRVILLGVRQDMADFAPDTLVRQKRINAAAVLDDLPKLRSGLSREEDTHESWEERICEIVDDPLFGSIYDEQKKDVWDKIGSVLSELESTKEYGRGGEFLPFTARSSYNQGWFGDSRLKGVCNHTTKAHMSSDLHRYLFASCFAAVHARSPTLPDFPPKLWPDHKNIMHDIRRSGNFSDRFRVQIGSKPSTTIMSHISKDGHYYIHYDPSQCRSLTVREAARLQTFPDNYFFCGNRTQQYVQVGNAVPPLLARQIASVVKNIIELNGQ